MKTEQCKKKKFWVVTADAVDQKELRPIHSDDGRKIWSDGSSGWYQEEVSAFVKEKDALMKALANTAMSVRAEMNKLTAISKRLNELK